MERKIDICYPVPRRRLLDMTKLRRVVLRLLCAVGALFVFINVCTGGAAWSAVVAVSLWLVWTNAFAKPLVEDSAAGRVSRFFLSVCVLLLTVELCFGGSYTGIVLPVLLCCTLAILSAVFYLGRRGLMPLLRLLALCALDLLAALCGALPANAPASITLLALSLAACLPALFMDRTRLKLELKKRLHR